MLKDINSLNKEEIKKFEDFVNSPYFNKYETVKKLFYYLKDKYPKITSEYVSKINLSVIIYGEKTFNSEKIRKLESDFNKLFEKFLLVEESGKKKCANEIFLLSVLRERRLIESFRKKINVIKSFKKKDFGTEVDYYLNRHKCYNQFHFDPDIKNFRQKIIYCRDKLDYLSYYSTLMFLVYNMNYSRIKVYDKKGLRPPFNLINSIIEFVEKNKEHFSRFHPIIMLYYYSYLIFSKNDIRDFNHLQKYFNDNKKKFDYTLSRYYYEISEGFLNDKVKYQPDKINFRKLLDHKKKMMELKIYKRSSEYYIHIPTYTFFQMFNVAVNLRDFDWAEKYMNTAKGFVFLNEREDVLNITYIILKFFRGEYSEVYTLLNKVKKDIFYQLIYSRYIKMMLLYEAGEFTTLEYETESMRKLLERKKAGPKPLSLLIERSYVFINSIIFLMKFKNNKTNLNGIKSLRFRSLMNSNSMIPSYKFWFKDKFKELEKNQKQII